MYISIEEFEKALYPSLRQILTADSGLVQDDTVIEQAIKQASSMIDSYAGYRYTIPITNVTDQIKSICVDITLYILFRRKNAVTDTIYKSYLTATQYLRDLATDKAMIDGAGLRNADNITDINNVYAKSSSDTPKFDDDTLLQWDI